MHPRRQPKWAKRVAVLCAGMVLVTGILLGVEVLLGTGLTTVAENVRTLETERERSRRLEETRRQTLEYLEQRHRLVSDLWEGQCDLREAAARFREICPPPCFHDIRSKYPDASGEEDCIHRHLIFLVGVELESRPKQAARILSLLKLEKALLQTENARRVPRTHGSKDTPT